MQLVILDTLKEEVLQQLHNESGYLGVHKTLAKTKERFYWPGYETDVSNWAEYNIRKIFCSDKMAYQK